MGVGGVFGEFWIDDSMGGGCRCGNRYKNRQMAVPHIHHGPFHIHHRAICRLSFTEVPRVIIQSGMLKSTRLYGAPIFEHSRDDEDIGMGEGLASFGKVAKTYSTRG